MTADLTLSLGRSALLWPCRGCSRSRAALRQPPLPKPWRVALAQALGVRGEDSFLAPAGRHPRTTDRPPKPAAEPADPPVPNRPRGRSRKGG